MTDLHTAVLAMIIKADREHAVDRHAIRSALSQRGINICPRDIQDVIMELQAEGHRIVSSNHGRSPRTGYWIARHAEDAEGCREAARRRYAHAEAEKLDADMLMRWANELQNRPRPQQTAMLFAS